jgi:hypothetical protein
MNEDRTDGGLINVADLDLDELLRAGEPGITTALDRILATSYEPGYNFASGI